MPSGWRELRQEFRPVKILRNVWNVAYLEHICGGLSREEISLGLEIRHEIVIGVRVMDLLSYYPTSRVFLIE